MKIPGNQRSFRTIVALKPRLFIRAFLTCLLVAACCIVALPGSAVSQAGAAQKAFDDWVAANEAVKKAKKEVKDAIESRNNVMAVSASGGITAGEEAALEKARARVAAAEAALQEAEAKLEAARIALEKAIAELEDEKLKQELIRKRDGYIADQRFAGIARVSAEAVTASGMHTATFATPNGSVKVHLPDDMAAGDTISGTVVAEAKGGTQEERSNNMAELRGYVIDLAPNDPNSMSGRPSLGRSDLFVASVPANNPNQLVSVITFTAPRNLNVNLYLMPNENSPLGPCRRSGSLVAINEGCSPISQLVFRNPSDPIIITQPTPPPGAITTPDPKITTPPFSFPLLGQTGRPIVVTGPFDGNSANTGLRVGTGEDRDNMGTSGQFLPLAESPRKAVFAAPTNATGPTELRLTEGNTQSTGSYRNVGVNLTAPKPSLLKGESTTLRVEVKGLEGLKQPVPLTLECTGVITMAGGIYQPLVIQPSEVGADGSYTTTRGITGVQPGGWGATATVVTARFNACLQDDTAPHRRILWNTFNGEYVFINPFPPKPPGQPPQTGGTTPTSLTGAGKIARKGCILTLSHNAPDRRVFSTLDTCNKTGNSTIEDPKTKVKATITDRSTADNTCPSQ